MQIITALTSICSGITVDGVSVAFHHDWLTKINQAIDDSTAPQIFCIFPLVETPEVNGNKADVKYRLNMAFLVQSSYDDDSNSTTEGYLDDAQAMYEDFVSGLYAIVNLKYVGIGQKTPVKHYLSSDRHLTGYAVVIDVTIRNTENFCGTIVPPITYTISRSSHTHANLTTLNLFTDALKASYDLAVTNSHTHSNKAVIDTIDATLTRNYVNPTVSSGALAFDFGSRGECFATKSGGGGIVVNENITVSYSNITNAKQLWASLDVTTTTRTITFPVGSVFNDTRVSARVASLPVGKYEISVIFDGTNYFTLISQIMS